jgi:hypothetical protein
MHEGEPRERLLAPNVRALRGFRFRTRLPYWNRCFCRSGLSETKWWAALPLARKRPFRLPKLAVGVIEALYVARTIDAYAENRARTRRGGAPRAAHNLGDFMAVSGDRARRKVLAGVDHEGASRHGSKCNRVRAWAATTASSEPILQMPKSVVRISPTRHYVRQPLARSI